MRQPRWSPNIAASMGRALLHTAEDAALGTLGDGGSPHTSHVAIATLTDGEPLILISDLALHTKNVRRDNRASLLFVATRTPGADTNTRARVTVEGRLLDVADKGEARERYLRRQPAAALYADFADFHFMRLAPEAAHMVAGFGRATSLPPEALLAPQDTARAIADIDEDACRHMDEDYQDAMALMATVLAGGRDGAWRAIGVDPLGVDLGAGGAVVRVEFDAPVSSSAELRKALKTLADRARAAWGRMAPHSPAGPAPQQGTGASHIS